MAIFYGFADSCLFSVVSDKRQRQVIVCSLNSQITSASKNAAPIHYKRFVQAHARLPRTKSFQNIFPQKIHHNTYDEKKR